MRRTTVALLLCTLWGLFTEAQTIRHDGADIGFNQNQCIIPFRMTNRLIMIEATINGITGSLYVDTAIDGLVINGKYFKSRQGACVVVNSNGATIDAQYIDASVELACFSVEFNEAKVMNLDHFGKAEKSPMLGLIGCDVFKGFELEIDFRNEILKLLELDRNGVPIVPNPSRAPIVTLPFQFKGPWPVVEASIGTQKVDLVLDTGASVNVLHKRLYKKLSPFHTFIATINLRTWDKNTIAVPLTGISQMALGGILLGTMNTVWYDLSLNAEFSRLPPDGVLGQELLKQYKLAMNFRTLEVSLYHYETIQSDPEINVVSEETVTD